MTTAACGFYLPQVLGPEDLPTFYASVTRSITDTFADTPIGPQHWQMCWTPTHSGVELVVTLPAELANEDSLQRFATAITGHGLRPLTDTERDDVLPRAMETLRLHRSTRTAR